MSLMQAEPTVSPGPSTQQAELRELAAALKLEIARLEADIARAEVRRLKEQLAWERAWRRRGFLGRLF